MEQQGKGRPTPKRRDAQKRRGGPVSAPPTNRKEAARLAKARAAEERQQRKTARASGRPAPERPMLPRDAGPVRKRVRDVVDGRRNVAGLLLPVAVVMLAGNAVPVPVIQGLIVSLWLTVLLFLVFDSFVLARLIRRTVREQFPTDDGRGHVRYGLLRSTVLRRMRMPRPAVAPGPRR